MATDYTHYEIVEIGEANWGIQYSDGSLKQGFVSRQEAINVAEDFAITPPPTLGIESAQPTAPRNLEEALVVAQSTRDNYREFVGNNPSASQEQKDAMAAQIAIADAQVSEYQQQQAQAVRDSLAADAAQKQQIDFNQQLANADARRKEASYDAAVARKNQAISGYTPDDIAEFDNKAFEAETYYESLQRQQANANNSDNVAGGGDSNLFSGGSKEVVNFGGQIASISADISSAAGNTFDTIKTSLSNLFGSITTSGATTNSQTAGYGTSAYGGTTVYDTNVGVTSVSSSSDQRIKISPKPSQRSAVLTGVLQPLYDTGGVVFPFTPSITMQGNTNYNALDPVQSNQDYLIYQNTPSIDISISGIFTAQNETEAKYLLASAHFFRVFTKMHFGYDDNNAGLPPPQLQLDGYGTYMFNGLSVILRNYEMVLPDNVDYVTVNLNNGTSKVPTMTTFNILLTVQQSPTKAKAFNWDSFASGELMQQKGWI